MDLGSYLGYNKDQQVTPLWMRWLRLMMGLMLSPCAAMQVLLGASEVVKVGRSDLDNPFRWLNIRLDLPGDPRYSPTIPWIPNFLRGTQDLDTDFTTYLYGSRLAAGSAEEA